MPETVKRDYAGRHPTQAVKPIGRAGKAGSGPAFPKTPKEKEGKYVQGVRHYTPTR